jgi:hypothetical protein
MAFIDNSGDIILDAVLTDAGRKRLAAGDGSFRIAKFALGDDEIDYSLYNTGDTSVLKNKLLTYADNSLLYLPVIKLNNKTGDTGHQTLASGGYRASVDTTTSTLVTNQLGDGFGTAGYRNAAQDAGPGVSRISFDQGLDSADLSLASLSTTQRNLMETQYIVEVDNRLLQLTTGDGSLATPTFIDDDSVASYYFSMNSNPDYFADYNLENINPDVGIATKVIGPTDTTGRLGPRFFFGLRSTLDLQVSTSLFTQLGKTGQSLLPDLTGNFSILDTVVRVTGFTTGYRTDVPLQLIKLES